jgi:hypothetical protein
MGSHCDNLVYEDAAHATAESTGSTLLIAQKTRYELSLRVVPLAQVVPHEHYHGQRVAELAARLVAEGKLINPLVVARHGEKYVVLDGATRLTALRRLGYSCTIVQVVDLAQQQVQLTSWNHIIYGGSAAALLETLRGVPGLTLTSVTGELPMRHESPNRVLGYLTTVDKESYVLEARSPSSTWISVEWLQVLNDVVEAYGQWGNVERTLSSDVEALARQFPDLAALVRFPRFRTQTILQLADQGLTVPAGITRFVIPGRILRLNAPLEKLAGDEPLAAKQAWLDELIHKKLRERQVRFYEEPVVLLDE